VSSESLTKAIENIHNHTLRFIHSDFARLVYLASIRDYNTGAYSHFGLESRFSKPVVEMALETCHEEIFEKISTFRLERLVQDIVIYLKDSNEEPAAVIESWKTFAPYQLLPPRGCKGVAKEYFISNVKIALAILEAVPGLYRS